MYPKDSPLSSRGLTGDDVCLSLSQWFSMHGPLETSTLAPAQQFCHGSFANIITLLLTLISHPLQRHFQQQYINYSILSITGSESLYCTIVCQLQWISGCRVPNSVHD